MVSTTSNGSGLDTLLKILSKLKNQEGTFGTGPDSEKLWVGDTLERFV